MLSMCVCSVRVRLSSQRSDVGTFTQDEKFPLFCEPDEPAIFLSSPVTGGARVLKKLDMSEHCSYAEDSYISVH